MLDDFNQIEREELRRADQKQKRQDRAANRAVFMGEEIDPEYGWPKPNQPACATAQNAVVAVRKAVALAQRSHNGE